MAFSLRLSDTFGQADGNALKSFGDYGTRHPYLR